MDLKEIDILGNNIGNHWYYWSKSRAVLKILNTMNPKTILDIGAGSGFFSQFLLDNSSAQEAWCVDINYEKNSDILHNNKPIHFRQSIEQSDADLVLLMDVLEHVENDVNLLKEYYEKVPKGTKFLISVPAFQFLWSDHDVFLGHYRRYTLKSCKKIIQNAGLSVTDCCYFYGIVFPLCAILRLSQRIKIFKKSSAKSQLKKHNSIINIILKLLCKIELPIIHFNKFFGITVFCLAEKV